MTNSQVLMTNQVRMPGKDEVVRTKDKVGDKPEGRSSKSESNPKHESR